MKIETNLRQNKEQEFESLARYRGFIKKEEVLKLFKKYNFPEKPKIMKEIRKL